MEIISITSVLDSKGVVHIFGLSAMNQKGIQNIYKWSSTDGQWYLN